MPPEFLQERAALYVAGALSAAEREAFELVLEFHEGVRAEVARLQAIGAELVLAQTPVAVEPPAPLRERILQSIAAESCPPAPDALVVTCPEGRVEWVNESFTGMCGYSLTDLRGRKPGELLQGPATDRDAVARMRAALREAQPCRETLANYAKDGSVYRVDVAITPIVDDAGAPRWFVARERRLATH
ncbi:MAG: PAS domain-containing protein [Verrucomicrobia bacterium]|nr:PAS domain-containing protein [Verrucomicrobiota bacterium]